MNRGRGGPSKVANCGTAKAGQWPPTKNGPETLNFETETEILFIDDKEVNQLD